MKKKIILIGCLMFSIIIVSKAQSSSYNANPNPVYGTDNCGFGANALNNIGTGPGNTATGFQALTKNNGGEFNSADGVDALFSNYNGNANVASGFQSLYNNACNGCSGGDGNTATGFMTLYSNTDGNNNTANGREALFSNQSGNRNTASGFQSLFYNNSTGGGNDNTVNGCYAMYYNDIGDENTAMGAYSLFSGSLANKNTALGYKALFGNYGLANTLGYNTAIGLRTMHNVGTGTGNTAIGTDALYNNISDYNTVCGVQALYSNSGGSQNVAIGHQAMFDNTSGELNVAVGEYALYNNNAGNNSEFWNTAFGSEALRYNYGKKQNTAIGYQSFQYNNPGDANSILGANADIVGGSFSYASAVGYGALTNASYKIRLGDVNVTTVETQTSYFPIPSDGRFKYNISEEDVKGIDFVRQLRPVVYNFDTRKFTEFLTQNMKDSLRKIHLSKEFSKSTNLRQSGFIAQEVEIASKKVGYNFNGVYKPQNEFDNYSLAYQTFVIPIVKAIQEQQTILKEQNRINTSLQKEADEREIAINAYVNSVTSNPEILNEIKYKLNMHALINQTKNIVDFSFDTPNNAKVIYLGVYDTSGKQILFTAVSGNGKHSWNYEQETESLAGFFYSIIIDNKVMGLKSLK